MTIIRMNIYRKEIYDDNIVDLNEPGPHFELNDSHK